MATTLLDSELWELIEPLLPKRTRRYRHPGRLRIDDRRVLPIVAKRNTEHGSHLGSERWVVERTLSWLHQYRRLRIRYDRRADVHEAFLSLACGLIWFKQLKGSFS
jgi:transposase